MSFHQLQARIEARIEAHIFIAFLAYCLHVTLARRLIAQELKQTGEAAKRFRPQLKPGTRLMREWQARTYEVMVLDEGFSWQGTQYRSLTAIARKITGTARSGPLFFGLKQNRSQNP